jgi:hypothetical protein
MAEELSYQALCSVNDVNVALRLNLTENDPRLDLIIRLINAASEEIYLFADREFISTTKDYWLSEQDYETRTFDYRLYGLGMDVIEVGDMMTLPIEVKIDGVATTQYDVFPRNPLNGYPYQFIKFKATLDRDSIITITGRWGWPKVPEAVRQACIETVRLWYDQITLHSGQVEAEFTPNMPLRNLPPHVITSLSKYRRLRG